MDDRTVELLKLFSERNQLSLHDLAAIYNCGYGDFAELVNYLMERGLLEIEPNYALIEGNDLTVETPLRITQSGRSALNIELKERRSFKYSELRAWLTLAIALAAFIKSFFF